MLDFLHITSIISGVLTLAGLLSAYGWVFDLAAHFRLQYAVVQVICIGLSSVLGQYSLLLISGIFLILNLIEILPLYIPAQKIHGQKLTGKIKILFMNVLTSNKNYDKAIRYIEEANPDILALEEIDQHWVDALAPVLKKFSYQKFVARNDNFGLGLFSKLPLDHIEMLYGKTGLPSILAHLSVKGQRVDLLLTHPVAPFTHRLFYWRNVQLSELIELRPQWSEHLVVFGDLNTTSWSHAFKNFTARMGLKDSQKGFGIQLTWPVMMPMIGMTIDHCLISHSIIVLCRKLGPDIGSDHYPVYVELALPENS